VRWNLEVLVAIITNGNKNLGIGFLGKKKVPELASNICSQLCLLFRVAASLELLQLKGRILKKSAIKFAKKVNIMKPIPARPTC